MSSVTISGDTSGSIILQAPSVAGSTTLTLPTTSGTVLTSANAFSAGTGPAFSAYASVSQTGVANTTYTKITFDTEIFDTNSNFASSRFTPTVAGYYQLNASSTVGSLTTSHGMAVIIYKNGSQYTTGNTSNANSGLYPQSSVSAILYFNGSTDYAEIYVYGNFGGTYALVQGIPNTWFNGAMVRAA